MISFRWEDRAEMWRYPGGMRRWFIHFWIFRSLEILPRRKFYWGFRLFGIEFDSFR